MTKDAKRKPLWNAATEWKRGMWRRWLLSHLLMGDDADPTRLASPDETPSSSGVARAHGDGGDANARPEPRDDRATLPVSGERPSSNPPEFRSRFESLTDRFLVVEDALDSLNRRLARRDSQERRSEERMVELLERAVTHAERQSEVLHASVRALTRMEERFDRLASHLDRSAISPWVLRNPGSGVAPRTHRDSEPDERSAGPSWPPSDGARGSQHPTSAPPSAAATVHGSLAEMSLPTVLAMFEFERRTGRLTIESAHSDRLCLSMRDGNLLGSRVNERQVNPVDALRQALAWREGMFWFEPVPVDLGEAESVSVGSLLLEATRQNDEAASNG